MTRIVKIQFSITKNKSSVRSSSQIWFRHLCWLEKNALFQLQNSFFPLLLVWPTLCFLLPCVFTFSDHIFCFFVHVPFPWFLGFSSKIRRRPHCALKVLSACSSLFCSCFLTVTFTRRPRKGFSCLLTSYLLRKILLTFVQQSLFQLSRQISSTLAYDTRRCFFHLHPRVSAGHGNTSAHDTGLSERHTWSHCHSACIDTLCSLARTLRMFFIFVSLHIPTSFNFSHGRVLQAPWPHIVFPLHNCTSIATSSVYTTPSRSATGLLCHCLACDTFAGPLCSSCLCLCCASEHQTLKTFFVSISGSTSQHPRAVNWCMQFLHFVQLALLQSYQCKSPPVHPTCLGQRTAPTCSFFFLCAVPQMEPA